MKRKFINEVPGILADVPSIPPPVERDILPHEKRGNNPEQKSLKKGESRPQHKRMQKK